MSYSVMLNANSHDSTNLSRVRDLIKNLIDSYEVDHSKLTGLKVYVEDLHKLYDWSNNLVKLMNVVGNDDDVILEPSGLD